MEFINKIELRGYVGAVSIKPVGGEYVARFSLVTESAYNDQSGAAVIDTTWHTCICWSHTSQEVMNIAKGDIVHLVGRIRNYGYMTADGRDIKGTEVIASKFKIIKEG